MSAFDITLLPLNMRTKILPSEVHSFNGTQCWEWVGARNSKGYGSMTNGRGGSMLTHRRAYETLVGEIPSGLTIDHLCFNKICVNTDHMEPVTRGENARRGIAQQTHCKHGHPLSGDNVRLKKKRDGFVRRTCHTCVMGWQRALRATRKVEAIRQGRAA